ncbi:mevalonate kinase [Nocardia sp. NPDC101769]|uniref:mevalonate kinase n=1 Tax=Nocardia sp. NPDC101769 TaxID=3364333 RepID=UPI003828B1AF
MRMDTIRPDNGLLGTGRAAAKLILLGEHVVLYGRPAISLPVPDLGVTATAHRSGGNAARPDDTAVARTAIAAVCRYLRVPQADLAVAVDSDIPRERGLGSSAATAAAIIAAVADLSDRKLSDETLFTLVQESEALAHGNASGIDARTVISAVGPLWFQDGVVRPLPVADSEVRAVLVVADTGVAGSTRQAVALVRRRLAELGAEGEALLERAGQLSTGAAEDLRLGRFAELGRAMTAAQGILVRLGVSCPAVDGLVAAALAGGALGAKLSGGGLGGCVIALTTDAPAVRAALLAAGAQRCLEVPLGPVRT